MSTIYILASVDIAGALAKGSLNKRIYLVDNNKRNGSEDEGTELLETNVQDGDLIVWVLGPMQVETLVTIKKISIETFAGEDKIEQPFTEPNPFTGEDEWRWKVAGVKSGQKFKYSIDFMIESREMSLPYPESLTHPASIDNPSIRIR